MESNEAGSRRTEAGPPDDEQAPRAVGRPTQPSQLNRWDEWLEFIPSLLMALAVVLTAYSAYEATRWGGVQATDFATAGSLRAQANNATTIGVTQVSYDVNVFGALLIEFADQDFEDPAVREQALAIADRLFRDEITPAFEEWLAERDAGNPPDTILDVPSYSNANLEEAERLTQEAEEVFEDARKANQTGDDYILATVLFASVLFFGGIRLRTLWVRSLIQVFALLALTAGIVRLATLPFE